MFLGPTGWLKSKDLKGPWSWATALPEAFGKLPDDEQWAEARDALPEDFKNIPIPADELPKVFYTLAPSELIQFDGKPQWQPIGDTGIEYSVNTRQECFRFSSQIFFLASGRWFQASSIYGPWTLASTLPDGFQAIPADHELGYVRANVPGTKEAWEAALIASIPQQAKFQKQDAAKLAPEVSYSGDPVFQEVEGTSLAMAINTSYQVLKFEDEYYLCYNAVWFHSEHPAGPWEFAELIPSEFSEIPPSSAAFNTTAVQVAEVSPEAITYSSTAAYENSYVSDSGTVVNGTGFVESAVTVWMVYEIIDHQDHYWGYPGYPYYPWPPSYGYGSWYNPNTGRYGESITGYGPFGAARSTAVYNPDTGTWGRGQSVWDSDEWAGRSYTYNPNTDSSISRRGYYDFDDDEGWSESVRRRGDEWIYSETDWDDNSLRTDIETSRGGEGSLEREREGDQTSGTGSFTTGGGNEITSEFSRERDGDSMQTERTLSGENHSVDISGNIEDGEGNFTLEGSEGGTGSLNRELEDGQLTGEGTFTKDGKTIDSSTTRTGEGVKREFESSEGGQAITARQGGEKAFAAKTGSGDVYAGRDGEVYKKTDSGWEKVNNSTSSSSALSSQDRQSATAGPGLSGNRDNTYSTMGTGTERSYQLDRDRQSRNTGYDRYQSHRQGRMPTTGGRARTLRRR